MEQINTETLVSSLLTVGFDKVDAILYTYTLEKLVIDNCKLRLFEYKEVPLSKEFSESVYYDGVIFKFKNGVSSILEKYTNKRLMEYLSKLDYRKIVLNKIETLGFKKIDLYPILFSNKEKEIINKMFDIDKVFHEETPLSNLIEKVLEDPSLFYQKIGESLTPEEKSDIKVFLTKSCNTCQNQSCRVEQVDKPVDDCFGWQNDRLVGEYKVLKLNRKK